ncbi:unnamed protein product [Adineta steineri]|uniref:C2H2-type domain-containing protein n=1 Tax=Adineta steineri TaxID=433720 RepID=A0A814DY63_9BILA|nr:unnamed protein product [Adineta steineri]CAF0943855.1 unnamed protein product [Adineta steineri]CAF0959832.1 unnamed protein product [Adineta steineri]CAF3491721.1 unnamed protein product [Adineta steineri]CAF3653156.1 unnamed protein product [Adineta steineri]
MLSNIDEAFLLSLKNEFGSNSSSTFVSSELLSSYSPIETLTSELDCFPNISQDLPLQSSIPTHFDMTNQDDLALACSLIKNSVVQIERTSNEDILRLINNNRNKLSITSPSLNISIDDMPRVRGPKSTRFTCPICGLITVSMERLQRHVNQHGQKLRLETYKPERKVSSLICEKCKATFSSAYALRKHQRVHTRDKPFSCDFCGSKFSQWGNLRHHIQRHLGISPYACPYCKKTFIAPCKLEVHIRGHLDERPYVCDRCQATFRCNDDLRKHLIIHADYKPFVCWICSKPFFHASKLRMHLKEKHDTDVTIRKKDVLESGTEYEITFVNSNEQTKEILPNLSTNDEQTSTFYETILNSDENESRKLSLGDETCDEPVSNYQLLNELSVNDIETFVKNNPFVLSDNELRTCSSGGGHHQHFDDLKLIDFPVM